MQYEEMFRVHYSQRASNSEMMTAYDMKSVAIVVPIATAELTPDEKISLRQLLHFLGNYDTYIVAPKGLKLNCTNFPIVRFSRKFFKSLRTYSWLLQTQAFYRSFNDYDYVLVYQLDCLVFSDRLQQWCEKGYDYIGAPWLKEANVPYSMEDAVGNGGFSLRKVQSALEVLRISKRPLPALRRVGLAICFPGEVSSLKSWLKVIIKEWRRQPFTRYVMPEDYFWSFEAKKYKADFNIPSVDIALQFAFETTPELCFERNQRQLPFGCHAWAKWDRKFWEPYLS